MKPSSMSPSQSLSRPSQISGGTRAAAGLAAGVRRQAFVDLTVAVVVQAVAGLDRAVPGGAAALGQTLSGSVLLFGAIVKLPSGDACRRAQPAGFDTPSSI